MGFYLLVGGNMDTPYWVSIENKTTSTGPNIFHLGCCVYVWWSLVDNLANFRWHGWNLQLGHRHSPRRPEKPAPDSATRPLQRNQRCVQRADEGGGTQGTLPRLASRHDEVKLNSIHLSIGYRFYHVALRYEIFCLFKEINCWKRFLDFAKNCMFQYCMCVY